MKIDNTIVKSFRGFRTLGLFGILFCLIGCSGEQIDGPGNEPQPATEKAIAFSADLPEESEEEAMTRAIPLEETGYTTFKVWGYKNMSYDEVNGIYGDLQTVFPGYIVNWEANTAATTTSNTHDWEYVAQQTGSDPEQTIKYWDFKAEAYRFFAVTNYAGNLPADPNDYVVNEAYEADGAYGTSYPTKEFTMLANCSDDDGDATPEEDEVIAANMAATPYFSRLWFSTNELPTYSDKQFGQPVTLEFVKPYSRVRFMFTYSYPPEGIRLKSPRFLPSADYEVPATAKGIPTAGTFTVIYPLTGTRTYEDFSVTDITATIDEFNEPYVAEGTKKWYTVLPAHAEDQGSYTLSVRINGIEKTAVVPETYMTWLPGYAYTYIFKITEEGGVEIELVLSAVTSWDEHPVEYTVYNW